MDEAAELAELNYLINSPGNARDSAITASKFNRWLVGEQNRGTGEAVRGEVDKLRQERLTAQQRHREYGQSLKKQSKEQLTRDKAQYDATRQQNLSKGAQVKAEVAAQKAAELAQKQAWQAHGRSLAQRDAEQRAKIRNVVGEGSKRVAEMTAKAKQEELDFERELKARRKEILEENQREVQKVRLETADEVIDGSKEFAFEQRSALARATKEAESAWREERNVHTKSHLNKAKNNKADAEASRAKAKALREGIVSSRQQQAASMRKQHQAIKEQKAALQNGFGGSVKATHDSIYRNKFVPKDAAARFAESKYASAVA